MQNTSFTVRCVCVHFQEQGDALLHNHVNWSISGNVTWTQYYSTIIQTVSTVPVSSTATFLVSRVAQGLGMILGYHFLLVFQHFFSFFFFHDINILKTSGQLFCIIPLGVPFMFPQDEIYSEIWKGRLSLTVHKWNLITNTLQFFFPLIFSV